MHDDGTVQKSRLMPLFQILVPPAIVALTPSAITKSIRDQSDFAPVIGNSITLMQYGKIQRVAALQDICAYYLQASESRLYTFSDETKQKLRKFRLGTSRSNDPQAVICT